MIRALRTLVVITVLGALGLFATSRLHAEGRPHTSSAVFTSRRAPALKVLSVSPTPNATGVSATAPVRVVLSAALASNSPHPGLTPPMPGRWREVTPTTWQLRPTSPLLPLTSETLSVPGGPGGMRAKDGASLSSTVHDHWTVANGSILRLQQLLATLGYLPLRWTPSSPAATAGGAGGATAGGAGGATGGVTNPLTELYSPPSGKFSWRYPNTPASLQAAWKPGVDNHMTRGALVAFERKDRMPVYTTVRAELWPVLLRAVQAARKNPEGYTYAVVSESRPESVSFWHNGKVVYSSIANTGLPQSPTPTGTFFVYLRYKSQTMRGQNPNGSYYVDHGVKWINYFDGSDAVHGFVRASYGFPQSVGCVELPVAHAAVAWTWLHYGSLVTVIPPAGS